MNEELEKQLHECETKKHELEMKIEMLNQTIDERDYRENKEITKLIVKCAEAEQSESRLKKLLEGTQGRASPLQAGV